MGGAGKKVPVLCLDRDYVPHLTAALQPQDDEDDGVKRKKSLT